MENELNLVQWVGILCVGLFCGPCFAQNSCQTHVLVNDPMAIVSVDGITLGSAPIVIACKSEPQVVRIESPDKHPFVRVMPSEAQFKAGDSHWDVRMQYRPGAAIPLGSSANHLELKGTDQSQVLAELRELRKLIEEMRFEKRDVGAAGFSRNADRSLARVPEHREAVRRRGTFVQLHALQADKYNQAEIVSEIKALNDSAAEGLLQYCVTPKSAASPAWTKVLLGPLASSRVARKIMERIGRGTFILRNPECISNLTPASEPGQ